MMKYIVLFFSFQFYGICFAASFDISAVSTVGGLDLRVDASDGSGRGVLNYISSSPSFRPALAIRTRENYFFDLEDEKSVLNKFGWNVYSIAGQSNFNLQQPAEFSKPENRGTQVTANYSHTGLAIFFRAGERYPDEENDRFAFTLSYTLIGYSYYTLNGNMYSDRNGTEIININEARSGRSRSLAFEFMKSQWFARLRFITLDTNPAPLSSKSTYGLLYPYIDLMFLEFGRSFSF